MNTETYAVVTYDEIQEAKQKRDDAIEGYRTKYKNYLLTCLCNAGLVDVKVRVKETNDVGVLRVEGHSSSQLHPYEIKFYPVKKDGNISLNSRMIPKFWCWELKNVPKLLKELLEVVGDSNES